MKLRTKFATEIRFQVKPRPVTRLKPVFGMLTLDLAKYQAAPLIAFQPAIRI